MLSVEVRAAASPFRTTLQTVGCCFELSEDRGSPYRRPLLNLLTPEEPEVALNESGEKLREMRVFGETHL